MEITFYYAPMSSAVPVASALAELGVPHKQVTFDLSKQEQRSSEFLKLNPHGKVPTLVVDGTPIFEALEIMQWLGDRFGVKQGLWPASDSPEHLIARSWSGWAYVSYGQAVNQLWLAKNGPDDLRNQQWADHARGVAQERLSVLDGHLSESGFVVGGRFSLADLIVSQVVLWSTMFGISIADHVHVSKWARTCAARPSIKKEFVD